VPVAASHQAQAEKIAAELAAIARTGMVLPGSITQRRTRCGRANCGCHADPPRLHGPYWQWTRKVAAKTICRWLSPDQHRDYQAWVGNDRRLHELLARLEALGAAALDADPRWKRQPAARTGRARQPPEPEHKPPDNVGSARLTCGHPLSRTPSAQVSPKREDLAHGLPTEVPVSYRQNCLSDLFLSIARGSDNGSGRRVSWFRCLRWPVAGQPADAGRALAGWVKMIGGAGGCAPVSRLGGSRSGWPAAVVLAGWRGLCRWR